VPSPQTAPPLRSGIRLGLLNTISVIKQIVGVLHDTIHDHNLDLLAITETRLLDSAPDAVRLDMAPAGFTMLHAHRRSTGVGAGRCGGAESRRGGGLAQVFWDNLSLKLVPAHDLLLRDLPKTTYELLLARLSRLRCPQHSTALVGVIYRPPSSSVSTFVSEFACILDRLTGVKLVLCGDYNTPGARPHSVCQEPHPHQRQFVGLDFRQRGQNRCKRPACCICGRL